MQIIPKLGSLRRSYHIRVIADFLDKRRTADRMRNLNAVIPFATSYIATTYGYSDHDDNEGVAAVLSALWCLPVDDRTDVLSRADHYAQNRPLKWDEQHGYNVEAMYLKGHIDRVVLSIGAIPRRERDTVLALMGRYHDRILLDDDGTDCWCKLVKWLGYVPQGNRQEFIEKLIVYRENRNFKSIVEMAALLPSSLWPAALMYINELPDWECSAHKILTYIFKEDVSFRCLVEHAWNSDLRSDDVNRATLVCGFLAQWHKALKIDSTTPLFQALRAAALPIIKAEASNPPLGSDSYVIPMPERSDAAFEMAKYLVHNSIKLTWLDDLIEQTPPEEKGEIAKQMLHYLPFINGLNSFNAVLRKIRKIPIQERAEAFLCVKTVLENLEEVAALINLIKGLRIIPAGSRLQLVTKVNTFLTHHHISLICPWKV